MRKGSYESILSAVGRVLDTAGAHGFAIKEADDGLQVETFDVEGMPQYAFRFGLPDLAELLEWSENQQEAPRYARASAADEGTLAQFLAQHSRELVGTSR